METNQEQLPYNPKKIGKRISIAGEHVVYQYGSNQVIKFPYGPIHKTDSQEALKKIQNDFRFIQKYFSQFLVPSKLYVFKQNNEKTYCIIQDLLDGRPLKPKDTKNPAIKKQLHELLLANQRMYETTRYTLEFFGLRGLLFHPIKQQMENVRVVKNNQLKIIDFGLISELTMVSSSIILRWFIQWAIKRQKKLLKLYLQ